MIFSGMNSAVSWWNDLDEQKLKWHEILWLYSHGHSVDAKRPVPEVTRT